LQNYIFLMPELSNNLNDTFSLKKTAIGDDVINCIRLNWNRLSGNFVFFNEKLLIIEICSVWMALLRNSMELNQETTI
ncbi:MULTISPECIES: hypothetical protein, partial [Vibrio]|uniref:hypothetical protein n=1 Tax=Vibrio TaxID=662 RepID=UPI001CDD5DD6